MGKTPGQLACEAWTESHLQHHDRCNFVRWDGMKPEDKADWLAAAAAVLCWKGSTDA